MSGGFVQLFPAGGGLEPGMVTGFPANVIPYINGSQEVSYDANFTYQSNNLGVGASSVPSARVHITGNSDTTGSAFIAQSLSNEAFRIYNNRQIVAGGGSAATTTDFTYNAFTSGSDISTRIVAQFKDSGSDTIFKIHNSPAWTAGGVSIARSTASHGRTAFSILGSTTPYIVMTSAGKLEWPTEIGWPDVDGTYITNSSTAGYRGMLFNITSSSTASFQFHKGRNTNSLPGAEIFMRLFTDYTDNGNAVTTSLTMHKVIPTYNFTGSGDITTIGYDYDPVETALNGPSYGALIRKGLSGFGLGATMPTATVSIAASTAANAPLNIPAGTDPSSPNDGDIWTSGTDLKIRLGGTTYTITKV